MEMFDDTLALQLNRRDIQNSCSHSAVDHHPHLPVPVLSSTHLTQMLQTAWQLTGLGLTICNSVQPVYMYVS